MAAEAILSLLGERLLDLAVREAVYLRGVNEEVRGLVDELERMKSALKVADGRQEQEQDDLSRTLVNQIRECAEDAEDVIETHILKVVQTNKFSGFMTKPFHLHTIGEEVRAIQARLERISKTLPGYRDICGKVPESSNSNSNQSQQLIRRTLSVFQEEFVVSSEGITREVLAQLMKEEDGLRVVSIVGMGGIGIGVKTCRIHDLLRDLCVKKAREDNFLGIIQPPSSVNNGPRFPVNLAESSKARRIAIHPSKRQVVLEGKHPKLRSLLLFDDYHQNLIELRLSTFNNFKLLRVLNLVRGDEIKKWRVSSEIGNLHHLRYFRIESFGNIIMPGSICKLKNLSTLHIKCDRLTMTPQILLKLERLRHFSVRPFALGMNDNRFRLLFYLKFGKFFPDTEGVYINLPPRDNLKNIETLENIKVGKNFMRNIDAMLGLTNVQTLGLIFQSPSYVEPIVDSLIKLQRLQSLHMDFFSIDGVTIPNLEPLYYCRRLTKLLLRGRIQEGDGPHSSHPVLKFLPKNITKLTLEHSMMWVDPMAELGKLQHLRFLQLSGNSYYGTKLVCSANGFPQLDSLKMADLVPLEEWVIEEGAMPCLRSFELFNCPRLKMLPEGLRYITTLQEMSLQFVEALAKRSQVIDGREGEDFYKVRHIPSIQIFDM
ncbi:hypothetical protein COLO4_15098 [Corchorus olitorius]|uniref:Uncharacterized protein n=1 Tax=Corchorus olitorius TaxID=93759 RepID=A0A1R3JPL4_9ROSI|nr:hypothetical protein COLO4_15098 [Corchorus olitorius]